MKNQYNYTPLQKPIPITEQHWPKGTLPIVATSTATFNHVNFIKDCIEGILMQKTTFPVKICIFNDCSTDGTTEIIKEYEEKYPELFWVTHAKENTWRKPTRNEAMKPYSEAREKAKYIAMCEGDDYWTDPLKLQKQVDFLEANPEYVMTGHDAFIINEKGQKVSKSKLPDNCKKDVSADELKTGFWVLTLSMVFRKVTILKNYPSEAFKVANGDTFLISMLGHYGAYHYMPEIKPAGYRIHSGGVWSSISIVDKINAQKNTFFQLYKYHKRIGDKETAQYFYKQKQKQTERYLLHCFENKEEFFKAYIMYFKEFQVYKNPKKFIYLHKTLIKYLID